MQRLWRQGTTGGVYIGVMRGDGGFKSERARDTARLGARISSKFVLEETIIEGVTESVVAWALKGGEQRHAVATMLLKVGGQSVFEGLEEFSVVVVAGGSWGVVRGGRKDRAWKCSSNGVGSGKVEASLRICIV